MKKALVLGGAGFIGSHLCERLKNNGYHVRAVDIKQYEYGILVADEFIQGDLRDPKVVADVMEEGVDEVYQLAADMGGAGYIFTKEHDADIMNNSVMCNLNVCKEAVIKKVGKIFYSSSACVYPQECQTDTENGGLYEDLAYPSNPDSDYGWEKLFSERLYMAYARNYGLKCYIARFHNVFGPKGAWDNGKEKAPAAICRKVAMAEDGGEIEVWGDGEQTRSFLYIDECLDGIARLVASDCHTPLNIGSEEMVSINQLVDIVAKIANKQITMKHIAGPQGVRGRKSDNRLIQATLNWAPNYPLATGLAHNYAWIKEQIECQKG